MDIKEYKKQWQQKNAEKHRLYSKKYRLKYPEKIKAYTVKWRIENPAKQKRKELVRRALKAKAVGNYSPKNLILKFVYYGNKCIYCNTTENLTIEHKIPLSRGGTNWLANLAPACGSCNKAKKNYKIYANKNSRPE